MFEKFTERARKAMSLARQEAQRLNCEFIGTEHILLALLQDDGGVGQKALKLLNIDLKSMRQEIEKLVTPSTSPSITLGQLPFSPRTKRVIELAGEEACRMTSDSIGTGHLLVGLMAEDEGIASKVLRNLGTNISKISGAVREVENKGEGSLQPATSPENPRTVLRLFQKIKSELKEGRILLVNGETYLEGPSITIHGVAPEKLRDLAVGIAEKYDCHVFIMENFAPEK